MSFLYGLLVRFREKKQNPRVMVLVIFSIAVSFYFLMMFLSKMGETNRKISYYESHYNQGVTIVALNNGQGLEKRAENCSFVRNTYDYITTNQQKLKVEVVAADINYKRYYHLDSLREKQWGECFDGSPSAIISRELARNLHLTTGDTFQLNNVDYTIKGISDDPFLEKKVLVPIALYGVENQNLMDDFHIILNDKEEVETIVSREKIVSIDAMENILDREIESLKQFLLFLMRIFFVFFFVAVINIILVLSSLIHQTRKNQRIRFLCGESKRACVYSTIIEFLITLVISFHISILFYYWLLPFVPNFFYFRLTREVYLVELAFSVLLAFALSAIYSRKQMQS